MLDLSYLLFNFSLTDEEKAGTRGDSCRLSPLYGCNHCSSSIITVLLIHHHHCLSYTSPSLSFLYITITVFLMHHYSSSNPLFIPA